MKILESWLRSFCNPPLSSQALADTLSLAGFEVEEMQSLAPDFSGVVVASIEAVAQHPNADRLRVCTVNVGTDERLQIVCGAPNARVGIKVPCAKVGAVLPAEPGKEPWVIRAAKLRGVESAGMLCAARELGVEPIGDINGDGLWELQDDAPVGENLRSYVGLDDCVLTFKLTPNLGHGLSALGIARELSVLTQTPLLVPEIKAAAISHDANLAVHVDVSGLCGRFAGRLIKAVNANTQTPDWIRSRLQAAGMRAVNVLVDISNYVMLELGQPTHCFDADRLCGDLTGAIYVRWARAGETITVLGGTQVQLAQDVGVVACGGSLDASQAVAIAGVMGGADSAVSTATQNVYVESAFWKPQAIANRAKRLKLESQAAHRFERGVDPQGVVRALERVSSLILEICGGQAGPVRDQVVDLPKAKTISLRLSQANRVLGFELDARQCEAYLKHLGAATRAQVSSAAEPAWQVTLPSYRFDLNIEPDLIEELARLHGYERLPDRAMQAAVRPSLGTSQRRRRYEIARQLASLGYQETINYSFVDEVTEREVFGNDNPVRLKNPIASQQNVMRSSLLGSLLQVARYNHERKADRVSVFEMGRVFAHDDRIQDGHQTVRGIRQPMKIAGLRFGSAYALQWGLPQRLTDFFDVKSDVAQLLHTLRPQYRRAHHPALHPGRSAEVVLGDQVIGVMGELHPKWREHFHLPSSPVCFELDWQVLVEQVAQVEVSQPSKTPVVYRDIALVAPKKLEFSSIEQVIAAFKPEGGLRLVDATLFDVYEAMSADEKSLAIRLSWISSNEGETLTEAQIEPAVSRLVAQLAETLSLRLR